MEIDFDQYLDRVLSKSPNARITDKSTILDKINALKATNPNPLQLCNGHDFLSGISQFINQKCSVKGVNDICIASSCRITFTFDHYSKTKLYLNTKTWADDSNCIIY